MTKKFSKIICGGLLAVSCFFVPVNAAPLNFDADSAIIQYTQKIQREPIATFKIIDNTPNV